MPTADICVAARACVQYNNDRTLAAIMAETDAEQLERIVSTGAVEKTRAELAAIYSFPETFPPLPNFLQ